MSLLIFKGQSNNCAHKGQMTHHEEYYSAQENIYLWRSFVEYEKITLIILQWSHYLYLSKGSDPVFFGLIPTLQIENHYILAFTVQTCTFFKHDPLQQPVLFLIKVSVCEDGDGLRLLMKVGRVFIKGSKFSGIWGEKLDKAVKEEK